MNIKIVKADRDYSAEIEIACILLNLSEKDYTVEFYFGQDVEKDYERIYGSEYEISAGVYSEIGDRIFIKESRLPIIIHELSHLKFRKIYEKTNENVNVLDFIDEYLAKKIELNSEYYIRILTINNDEQKYKEMIKQLISNRKKELEIMSERLKTTTYQLKYMRRVANMIAWKEYLEAFKSYDYKNNIQYDLIDGLFMWSGILNYIDYKNVNEKFNDIKKIYDDYECKYLNNKNLDKTVILT